MKLYFNNSMLLTSFRNTFLLIIFNFLFLVSIIACSAPELYKKVGKLVAMSSPKGNLSFYRVAWGLSTDAFFLSQTSDICTGFKPENDYCFRSLGQVIYYNVINDTLYIYTRPIAIPPKRFDFKVVQKHISAQEDDKYEQMYQRKEIRKVEIDSLYDPICDVSLGK